MEGIRFVCDKCRKIKDFIGTIPRGYHILYWKGTNDKKHFCSDKCLKDWVIKDMRHYKNPFITAV